MSLDSLKRDFIGLPVASIIRKIEQHDPEAVFKIIDAVEEGRKKRHMASIAEEQPLLKTSAMFSLWHGLRNVFNLFGVLDSKNKRPHKVLQDSYVDEQAWLHIGNDLRRTIYAYLVTDRYAGRAIRLTPEEDQSLHHFIPATTLLKAQRNSL